MKTENGSESYREQDFQESDQNRNLNSRFARLKQAVDAAGGNTLVATRAGVGTTTLSGYMNGREWKVGVAAQIARACGVSLEWLLFGRTGQADPAAPSPADARSVPRLDAPLYDVELSAGPGCTASADQPVGTITVSKSLVPPSVWAARDRIVGVRVRGDSMEPTLTSGDVVGVDTTKATLSSGAIYALRTGDELLVKRVERRLNGDVAVISDNPRYREQIIDAETARRLWEDGDAPIRIIGKVVWRSGSTGE